MLILIPSIIGVLYFVNQKINLIEYEENATVVIDTTQEFVEAKKDKVDFAEIDDATGNDFREILKNWALNDGDKLKSEDVINILLIGSDASANESYRANSAENGNTDVMMIVSVDTEKETVKLVSIMRDSYVYMKHFDKYAKLNAACANGGPLYLVETIEDNFKIEIDGYVLVDFISFVEVIDVLGGVNVDVPSYVANSLNKDILKDNNMESGEQVLLDGEQALAFSRVRKTDKDGDVSRVARQRQVITALIEKTKTANLTEINDVADVIFKNIKTNIDKKTLLSYAKMALSDNWTSFTITELTLPTEDTRKPYSSQSTAWVWIVDYPLASQKLQLELYGETNIKLDEERETAITILNKYLS
jgi:LCP family protein required for cell wall assembly